MSRRTNRNAALTPVAPKPSSFFREEMAALANLWGEIAAQKRAVIALTIAALITRFFRLSNASLWMDEIVILQEAFAGKYSVVTYRAHSVHLEPARFFMHLFGQTPFGLRFWGALLGSLAIPLIYCVARWVSNANAALLAGLLALTNCFLLMYAQDGNYYGDMTFYTSLMLCGYVIFFRGAPHAGLLITAVVGFLNFKNHPIAAVPGAVALGGFVVGVLLFPTVRRALIEFNPARWLQRPLVPLIAIAVLFGASRILGATAQAGDFLATVITPGASSLTNVEFGWRLIAEHSVGLMLNYFRPNAWEYITAPILLILLFGGIFALAKGVKARANPSAAALAGFILFAILGSYIMIFNLALDRNFNLRYFTYLVPGIICAQAVALEAVTRRRAAYRPLAYLFPAVTAAFSLIYLMSDKSNYQAGMPLLRQLTPETKLIASSRNDLLQARYYLKKADIPDAAPAFTFLNLSPAADLYAGAFPFIMNGEENVAIISAWRYVNSPRLYAEYSGLKYQFQFGPDKFGPEQDLHIYTWRYGSRVLYPRLAAIFPEGFDPVYVAGAGAWRIDGTREYTSEGPSTEGEIGRKAIPILAAKETYNWYNAANFPEHTYFREIAEDELRNERDGSYDFMIFQPDGEKRHLSVKMRRRDNSDALVKDKNPALPSGHYLGIAVDGIHNGFWEVGSGNNDEVIITPNIEMSPGNHRLTISGLLPRLEYSPYYPWNFLGMEWTAGPGAPQPSLEATGSLKIAPGWSQIPAPGNASNPLANWTIKGRLEADLDEDLTAPGGDHPIRIKIPHGEKGSFALYGPAMPVTEGTWATYWFYVKLEALLEQEITPSVLFLKSNGEPLGGPMPINGPNIRGANYGKGWIRRQVTVPVPAGAKSLVPGFQFYPVKSPIDSNGTVWIGSLCSPGVKDAKFSDPALPNSYFGWATLETAP
ncbi:hypothetical protein BH09SUM1_BH09SUM1_22930 [soil metagenome]